MLAGLLVMAVAMTSAEPLWALDPHKQIGQYGHDSWTSQRGLPGEAVYQILQSKDGYLWIRTGSGLARFDGVRFVSMDEEIGNESVKAICMSADGDLLIRTRSRTIVYRDRQFTDYLPPAPLPDGGTRVLFESREHVVLAGAENFIYQLQKGGPKLLRDSTGNVDAILEDDAGKTWIAGAYALYTYEDGKLSKGFKEMWGALTLMEDRQHRLWAGTFGGLYRLDGYRSVPKPVLQPGIRGTVNAVLEDRQGNIWAGTKRAGVTRLTNGNASSLDSVTGLTDNNVLSLFEDREGSIWIGTSSGLDRLRDTKLTTFTAREGLPADSATHTIASSDGGIYVFCDDGGLARIQNDTVTAFEHNRQLPSEYLGGFLQSRDGSLWLGTGGGLSHIENGKVTVYKGDGLSNAYLSAISEDDESLIVTNAQPRALRFKDGKTWPFTLNGQVTPFTDGGPHGAYVFIMYYDRSRTFWIGSNHGFYKHVAGTPGQKSWQLLFNLPVTSIFDDRRGNLWLGGRMPGLIRFRISDGQVTQYSKRDGLFDGYVSHVLSDDDGNLWISTEDGIYMASWKDLQAFADGRTKLVPSTRYSLADGMKTTAASDTSSQPGGARTPDGRLWFTTMKGIVAVDPRHMLHNDLVPPVIVERVITDRVARPYSDTFTISPGIRTLEFQYTALSFRVPERVRFKYQLLGYDHDWVEAGSRRTAYYTNLPPGKYRFRVLAANDDGVWNEQGASVEVVLEPRFYQTGWFYVACCVAAILIVVAANRRNTRLIRARGNQLRALVAERTAALERSQRELEQIAHFDALTALPNRRMFTETFQQMRERTQNQGDGFYMLLIDFDNFKQINDNYGHDAGDAFLVEASMRLRAVVRASDCVARLGGDEFAVLLSGDQANLEQVCDRIVKSFADAIAFRSAQILTSASVGVAIFPEHGETQEELYKSADLALYEVKRLGRNNWRRYNPPAKNGRVRDEVAP
jgi:diguanylate cyclase (GGDEF)-like protein